ncbi:MAG: 1-acyl-sn-glycerol-3-phosphate acyltransferase [Pirellulales bacterium]|nr:1-acyl-sn-glycerol-3-phosphate acyltransferase [Pirellulales bacterium]
MNRQPFQTPPCWWSPKLSPTWVRLWRPVRRRMQRREQRLLQIEVHGAENLRRALGRNQGVLVTPNHSSHADCYAFHGAADQVGCCFYFMIAWQVFQRGSRLRRRALRQHGCFSVDREGTDMRAFRQAVEILQSSSHPLVVFPEGEVYHLSERITPFRDGPAAMALLAARKGRRPVVCVPCAMKYHYIEDPTPELLRLMDDLERAVFWRPRRDLSLPERIYRLAEGLLALKELEFFGTTGSGPVPERIAALIRCVLGTLDNRYGIDSSASTVPERVKALRHRAIETMESLSGGDPDRRQCGEDLDDLFLVVQAFSYPGDYVSQRPSIERIAETLDKFEEDVLGVKTATIRGARRATVCFGEPIDVETGRGRKTVAGDLTRLLEQHGQALLNEIGPPADRDFGDSM